MLGVFVAGVEVEGPVGDGENDLDIFLGDVVIGFSLVMCCIYPKDIKKNLLLCHEL